MKRTLTLLLILLLSAFSLFAGETSDTLRVVAYKKEKSNEPTNSLQVIDALTGTLATIPNESSGSHAEHHDDAKHLNMSDYINNYLDDSTRTFTELELSRKALFSVHVNGNSTGSYTINISFGKFANLDSTTYPDAVIKNVYYLRKFNAFFTSTGTSKNTVSKNDTTYYGSVEKGIYSTDKITVYSSTSEGTGDSLSFSWKVGSKTTSGGSYNYDKDTVIDYWEAEAMVALIIDKTTYTSKDSSGNDVIPNGEYEAVITVSLTVS